MSVVSSIGLILVAAALACFLVCAHVITVMMLSDGDYELFVPSLICLLVIDGLLLVILGGGLP
jgi:hypothetical protein